MATLADSSVQPSETLDLVRHLASHPTFAATNPATAVLLLPLLTKIPDVRRVDYIAWSAFLATATYLASRPRRELKLLGVSQLVTALLLVPNSIAHTSWSVVFWLKVVTHTVRAAELGLATVGRDQALFVSELSPYQANVLCFLYQDLRWTRKIDPHSDHKVEIVFRYLRRIIAIGARWAFLELILRIARRRAGALVRRYLQFATTIVSVLRVYSILVLLAAFECAYLAIFDVKLVEPATDRPVRSLKIYEFWGMSFDLGLSREIRVLCAPLASVGRGAAGELFAFVATGVAHMRAAYLLLGWSKSSS